MSKCPTMLRNRYITLVLNSDGEDSLKQAIANIAAKAHFFMEENFWKAMKRMGEEDMKFDTCELLQVLEDARAH